MSKVKIIVNKHNIKHNEKHPENYKKVLSIHYNNVIKYADTIEINGPSKIVYSPNKPLSCGARVWIETDSRHIK